MANADKLESGGVLWGRIHDTGDDQYVVTVEQADCFACDHTRGEGWALSDHERRALSRKLNTRNSELRPVGFWRAHLRPGLFLDTRDMDLMRDFFARPGCVALCVRPPATGGFFIWENGDIQRTSSYREFELPDAVQPVSVPLPAPKRPNPHPERWRAWAAGVVAGLLVAAAPFAIQSRASRTDNAFNMLSMRADARPDSVRLHWDAKSRVLDTARGATLWIMDGGDEQKLALNRDQLRMGLLEYKPRSSDVNFRMEVGAFSESLRVKAPVPEPVAVAEPAVVEEPPAPVIETKKEVKPKKARRGTRARRLDAPLAPGRVAELKDPEVVAPPSLALAPPARLERPAVLDRTPEAPHVIASVEQPRSSPIKKMFGWVPLGRKKDFTPARPVRQVQPHIKVEQPTQVAVRLAIDMKGIVQDASLLSKDVDEHVARAALEAAKRWKFEPATQDDKPVASNLVVRFQF